MSNAYYNRLTLTGNRAIEILNSEINYRFIDDHAKHGHSNPLTVYRIFYGLTTAEAKELRKRDVITDVRYSNDTQYMPTSTGFTLISEPKPLFDLQNHLLTFASVLDSHLIVCNSSHTIPINSCSTRYVVMDKNEIKEFVATRKITPPKKHTLETDKVINAIRDEAKKEAFTKLKDGVKWVTYEMFRF
ncbi:hypothetical protein [Polynucleobacter sp. P1-05-14]|uniref:hypothetical protein n=1 Tax=Polynucleobacter sp. P1-05-14 TaxID=1819732 RepID=UPI001C0CC01D|nr:hypothetical protein [Polynucleobacter sp. P1-05-14]MBU3549485.1 hypothetical protein [Polynucleobacter sp. P1-05-14]